MASNSLFQMICLHVNQAALKIAKENPKLGLFYVQGMTKDWEAVDAQISIHEPLIKQFMTLDLRNKRADLISALKLFNALQQHVLFDKEDENAVSSLRNQAGGIKLMMSRINKKVHNMRDGTRSKQVFKCFLAESAVPKDVKLSPVTSEASDDGNDRTAPIPYVSKCS